MISSIGSVRDLYRICTGSVPIFCLSAHAGVDLTGWTLTDATGISDGGATLVGFGIHNGNKEAWIATNLAAPKPSVAPFVVNLPRGIQRAEHNRERPR